MGPQVRNAKITPDSLPEPASRVDERLSLVDRICASAQFRRAAKLRDFLRYVVELTLNGQGESLSEQQIGRAVFGRAADYSPSEDNIVRAYARQLRVKLAEYFTTAGKDEPLVLEIPKGSYVPVFSQKRAAPPLVAEPAAAWQPPHLSTPTGVFWVLLAVVVGLIAFSAFLAVQNRALRRRAISPAASASPPPAPLAWVFDPDRPVTLVVADSCFGLMQDLAGRPASLDEYVKPEFWEQLKPSSTVPPNAERLMHRISTRELTSYADILLTTRILRFADAKTKISIRFARDVHPRELNSGNFVFLGSSYANPWVALYDKKRNFRIQFDPVVKGNTVLNKNPRPGERKTYLMLGEDGVPGATYGSIAFLPSDGTTGSVLIIEGTNMEGTEAAGSMILNPQSAHDLLKLAGIAERGGRPPFFEVLLETKALAGAPSQTAVVAWRK